MLGCAKKKNGKSKCSNGLSQNGLDMTSGLRGLGGCGPQLSVTAGSDLANLDVKLLEFGVKIFDCRIVDLFFLGYMSATLLLF